MRSSMSTQNNQTVQAKQAYVYQNIFESDYDIEDFAQYLAKQPPKYSSNLEDLTYDTVKKTVDAFVAKHKSPSKINTDRTQSMAITESKYDRLSVDYNNMDFYVKSKQCVKEINKFALTAIQLDILSYKKNQGRFMSRDYITFKIELPQLHKQIERRYSHFVWLRNILAYFHPGVVVPPLPKKKMKKIFTDDHLKKKGRMLQNFLRKCLQIPDLRNDQNMYRFLTMQVSQKFEEFVKDNKVEKGTAPMDKIKSATGKIEYGINEEIININKKGTQYFQKFTPFMKQLYKQVKRVEQNLGQCALHLQNLQDLSKKFMPTEEQFRRQCNKKDFYDDQERQKSFLQHITVMSQKYKQQLKSMREIWQKELYVKLKYQFHHSECFMNFITEYQSQEKTFYNMRQSLNRKKMKIYTKPMNDWDISEQKKRKFMDDKPSFNEVAPLLLPKKTLQLDEVELQYALQTKQLANSISHYAKFNNLYNLRIIERFLQQELKLDDEWSQKMRNMISKTFDFNLTDSIGLKSKIADTKNSIKGFFSQFDSKKQTTDNKIFSSEMIQAVSKKKGIQQVADMVNGM